MFINTYQNNMIAAPLMSLSMHQNTLNNKTLGFHPNLNFLKTSIQYLQNANINNNASLNDIQLIKKIRTEQSDFLNNTSTNFQMNELLLNKLNQQAGLVKAESNPYLFNINNGINKARIESAIIDQITQQKVHESLEKIKKQSQIIEELTKLVEKQPVKRVLSEDAKIMSKIIPQDELSTDRSLSEHSSPENKQEQPSLKRKLDSLEDKPEEIKIEKKNFKYIKGKKYAKKRSYVQKRKELKEIAELEAQLENIIKKNKKEGDLNEEILKDTKRKFNSLQKIKKINDKIEKIQELDVREEVVSNFLKIENAREIKIGSEFQVNIPEISKTPRRAMPIRSVWSPEWISTNSLENYSSELIELLGCKEITEDKTLRLLLRSNMDKDLALQSVRKNKTYYKNMLCPASRKYINELKKLS